MDGGQAQPADAVALISRRPERWADEHALCFVRSDNISLSTYHRFPFSWELTW